ncbi:MAG: response regulator, partial [bacterium]|nr:response regulator [bacterium]
MENLETNKQGGLENQEALKKKVILAEDDDTVRDLSAQVLKMCGCDVIEVKSAQALLDKIAEEKPDLIVTDINMPVDGKKAMT